MKLDRIKFAMLIGYLVRHCEANIRSDDMGEIDNMIDINVEPVKTNLVEAARVDELLATMCNGKKIEAIKAYRLLTGSTLLESKNTVEVNWIKDLKSVEYKASIIGNYFKNNDIFISPDTRIEEAYKLAKLL